MMEIKGLKKRYDARCVLDIPSLQIAQGERVALIGPNGSGKSTLIRLLAGTLLADEGTVSLLGLSRREIAYLPQKPYAFDLSVEQNVLLALEGLPNQRQRMREALESVGLIHLRAARGKRLSGGEVQRMALARIIARPHRLLLLDEPTASADIQAVDRLERVLQDYCEATNCTLLFSSHAPTQALRLSTRTIVLTDGRIVEDGETMQVLREPKGEATQLFLRHWRI
ncbi:Tungstate uptake system ATP-binding protein TupC [bioreactor metagenome]|uniref:Tungstate uptake system ATP-binding protein TupC n=1 Tax=bioreactor metagenome TaxID=1076179 RepID=A0A645DKZ4_9ZZZZ|nr:ABC transporter ATP-binding protein [Christensenella sp.]